MERKRVSFWRVVGRHYLWLPVIPAVLALILGGVGWLLWAEARTMARDGVQAVAVVTDRRILTQTDRDGSRSTRYVVAYRFNPSSDQTVDGDDQVSRALYDQLAVGQSVTVRFLPDDPARNDLEPDGPWLPAFLLALAGVALVVALGLGRMFGGRKLSILRAARAGEVREARVTGHVTTNVQVNGRTQFRFAWTDAAGVPGQSALMDLRALPETGSVVRIYVDPRSGRGWWEGDF